MASCYPSTKHGNRINRVTSIKDQFKVGQRSGGRASGNADYLRSGRLSPWAQMDGFHLNLAFHDPMHAVFLGFAKDLYASSMAFWMRNNSYYGVGNLNERLRMFSHELKVESRERKTLRYDTASFFLLFKQILSLFPFNGFTLQPYFSQYTWATAKDCYWHQAVYSYEHGS